MLLLVEDFPLQNRALIAVRPGESFPKIYRQQAAFPRARYRTLDVQCMQMLYSTCTYGICMYSVVDSLQCPSPPLLLS